MRIEINCINDGESYYSIIENKIVNYQNYNEKVSVILTCTNPSDVHKCTKIFEKLKVLPVANELYIKHKEIHKLYSSPYIPYIFLKETYINICSFFSANECTPYYSFGENALLLRFKNNTGKRETNEESNEKTSEILKSFSEEFGLDLGHLTYLGMSDPGDNKHFFCIKPNQYAQSNFSTDEFYESLIGNDGIRRFLDSYTEQGRMLDLCLPLSYHFFDIHMQSTARSEWIRVYWCMNNLKSYTAKTDEYFFNLHISIFEERVEGEYVDNLRYYFPLENAFDEHIKLHIKLQPNKGDQFSRILQFFGSASSSLVKTVYINQERLDEVCQSNSLLWLRQQIRGKEITTGADYGNFLSALEKNANSVWNKDFKDLKSPTARKEKTLSNLSKYASNMFPLMTTVLSGNTIDYPKNNILNHALLAFLKNKDEYIGTENNKIDKEKKPEISAELCNLIDEKAQNISTLAYTILLFILRNLVQQKVIFKENIDKLSSDFIREDIFDKVLVDAQSYANGLYQLIENSCQHSHGNKAFWSMRIYKADRNAPPGEFEEQSRTLVHLINRYGKKYMLKKKNAYFIEFFVLDEATDFEGIVTKYNQHFLRKNEKKGVNQIDEILDMTEPKYRELMEEISDQEDKIDDKIDLFYTQHYGLRWFAEITDKNNGTFQVDSPDGDETSHFTRYPFDNNKEEEYVPVPYFTEYSILLPLTYIWNEEHLSNENIPQVKTIDNLGVSSKIEFDEKLWPLYDKEKTKLDKIDCAYRALTKNVDFHKDIYWYIDISSQSYEDIEIVAKVLFKLVYHIQHVCVLNKKGQQKPKSSLKQDENNEPKVRIAICVGEKKLYIPEFVRIFSIFYGKMGVNPHMKNVQIALCSQPRTDDISKEINFVIAGQDFSSAFATANSFLYYGSESTVEYLHLLKYLTISKGAVATEGCSIFPFDLYLCSPNAECWFLERMKSVISRSLYMEEYGCKIPDANIKLSSGVRLDSFYTAELLFHNIATVYRFAYLLAKDIRDDWDQNHSPQRILLVGYESYSSVLLQTVKEMLGELDAEVGTAIVYQKDYHDSDHKFLSPLDTSSHDVWCYTIVPITTTMTTIYKLHDHMRLKNKNIIFRKNFSIIAVNDLLVDNSKTMTSGDICSRYWEAYSIEEKTVTLRAAKSSSKDGKCKVRYYLPASSEWLDGEGSSQKGDEKRPLIIQADKTSLLPKSIFELQENNRKKLSPQVEIIDKTDEGNKGKNTIGGTISSLAPRLEDQECSSYVWYAHVFNGENHFQFCFDFLKYVRDHESEIEKWARGQAVDRFAYNIIVSPTNITNSLFLKLVIDNCFSSSLRFLHIDINNIYKDDARAKFSYIAKEMRNLYRYNPRLTFNFYYVDNSIVTGQTLNRGRMLMQMIIQQSGIDEKNVNLFKKIFLLINRSSYETINTYVKNPETNFRCFLPLVPPSYNTQNDVCPGCLVQQRYTLLRKRSATIALSSEFARLENKHEKKNAFDYMEWLENQILHDPSYFAWYTVWLYHENIKESGKGEISDITEKIVKFVENRAGKYNLEHNKDQYLQKISTLTLEAFLKWDKTLQDKHAIIETVKFIVAQRAYLRLKTMDEAYTRLYEDCLNLESIVESTEKAKATIWKILASACSEGTFYDKFEAIMSYIKVISREHLANYYHIRSAIVSVMLTLLDMFVDRNRENWTNDQKNVYNTIRSTGDGSADGPCAALQSRLYITICHRLALLQCPQGYSKQFVTDMIKCYQHLQSKYFGSSGSGENPDYHSLELTRIPSERKVIEKYCVSIKTATMLTNDDSGCFRLLNLIGELSDNNNPKLGIMSGIRQTLLLENTRIIFDFMEALSSESKIKTGELIYTGLGGLKERKRIKEKEKECLERLLEKVFTMSDCPEREEIILRQNSLGRYVQYWRSCFKEPKSIKEQIPRLAQLFHYFRLVSHLSELQQEQMNEYYDALPYLYEDICLTLAENTNHKMCYIVTKDEDDPNFRIVARSGYVYRKEESCGDIDQLSTDVYRQYQNLFNDIERRERDGDIHIASSNSPLGYKALHKGINNIYTIDHEFGDKRHDTGVILSFPFSLLKTNQETDKRKFFIVLLNSNKSGETLNNQLTIDDAFFQKIGLVILLRDRLMQIFRRDYSTLLNYRYDCGYIQSVNEEHSSKDNSVEKKEKRIAVLHISDPHIDENTTWKKGSVARNNLCEIIDQAIKKETREEGAQIPTPDLMAVTGDIIRAAVDGLTAQNEYQIAGGFLLHIAIVLWGESEGSEEDQDKKIFVRLPHDWKRRIIITTGNHDYLTMNETVSVTSSRKTTFAKPLDRSGTTMMKFTYFIEFLQSFLDAPIDHLIADDMNEIRRYKNLGMNVLVLNTVSAANALQNNKVGVLKEKMLHLISLPTWTDRNTTHLCLSHHRPGYKIMYSSDIYSIWGIQSKMKSQKGTELLDEILDAKKTSSTVSAEDKRNCCQKLLSHVKSSFDIFLLDSDESAWPPSFTEAVEKLEGLLNEKMREMSDKTEVSESIEHKKECIVGKLNVLDEASKEWLKKKLKETFSDVYFGTPLRFLLEKFEDFLRCIFSDGKDCKSIGNKFGITYEAFKNLMKTEECMAATDDQMFKDMKMVLIQWSDYSTAEDPLKNFRQKMMQDEFSFEFYAKLHSRVTMSQTDNQEFQKVIQEIDKSVGGEENIFYFAGHEHESITCAKNNTAFVADRILEGFSIAVFERSANDEGFSTKINYLTAEYSAQYKSNHK